MADSDKDIVDPNADIDTYDESRHSPRRFPTEKLGQIADEASMMLDKVNSFFTADNTEVDGEKRSGELFNSELSRFSQEASNLKDALKLVQPEKDEAEKKQLEKQSSQDSLRKAAAAKSAAPRSRSKSRGRRR